MKKIMLIAACTVFALATYAQTNMDELKYLHGMFGLEKKQIVAQRLQVSKADSAKFWAAYDEYELYRSEISEKRAGNVQKYSENYAKLTDDQAHELVKTTFEVSNEFTKLLEKTFKIMSKDVSAVKAGQFVYLEMYFEAIGRLKLSEMIPHLGELPPMKK